MSPDQKVRPHMLRVQKNGDSLTLTKQIQPALMYKQNHTKHKTQHHLHIEGHLNHKAF